MNATQSPGHWLLRAGLLAAMLTTSATFAFSVEGGASKLVTDSALSMLLLTTLPISVAVAVWGVRTATDPLVAFGANRRRSSLLRTAALIWGLPLVMGLLTVVVLIWTRGIADARLVADLLATLPVAVMAGLSLTFVFLAAGQWFGRFGLLALLLLCVTLGNAEFVAAAVLPGAHVRHLLGVGATLPFDPGWSMAALWAYSALGLWAWLVRIPP